MTAGCPGRNVIAFSLYGNDPLYVLGLRNQISLLREFYPGWEIHVWSSFHPSHTRAWGIQWVKDDRLYLPVGIMMHKPPSWIMSPPSWRLAAANLPDLTPESRVIFRDADSRPSERESRAVYDWIVSGLPVHVMRDNAHHRKPMLSGMWGCIPGALPDLCPLYIEWQSQHLHNPLGYGNDEDFLCERVWPIAQQVGVLQHDRWQLFPDSVPFPGDNPESMPEAFIGEKVHHHDDSPVDLTYRQSRPEDLL